MSCGHKWKPWGREPISIHELEDEHLINIMRYLHAQELKCYFEEDGGDPSHFIESIKLLSKECERRHLDMDEILKTLEHPDPYKQYKEWEKEQALANIEQELKALDGDQS